MGSGAADPPLAGAVARRSLLLGIAAAPFANACAAADPTGPVSLPAFRRRGARDDNAALQAALATGRPVHLPAGGGAGRDGAYLLSAAPDRPNLVAGARLFGDGVGRTQIRRDAPAGPYVLFCDSGSADPARNLAGVRLRGFTISEATGRRAFAEHDHLVHLNGVSDLRIEEVEFRGFRGDGLYLGSGPRRADERHNIGVLVRRCRFDGIDRNNRNGLTIIDGRDVRIEDCEFLDCTRPGGQKRPFSPDDPGTGVPMPGAIDLEPDLDGHPVIANIRISRCRFRNTGSAAIALLLRPNDRLRSAQRDIRISDCVATGCGIGFTFNGFDSAASFARSPGFDVVLERFEASDCGKPFIVDGAADLTMTDCRFVDCARSAELGYSVGTANVRLARNLFERIGHAPVGGLNGMLVRNATGLTLEENRFVDCGQADGTGGRAINFVAGDIRRLRLVGNVFASPTGRTTHAMQVTGATLDRATLTTSNNRSTFQTDLDLR